MILEYDSIVTKIVDSTGLSKQDIEEKINEKLKSLQDLISKEGAANIVAHELNVKLFDGTSKNLKINEIEPGFNSVNVTGKIMTIYDIRSFQKNNRQGRIGSILLGDETGVIRSVIWDEKLIDLIKDMKEGDILKIGNAYSKQNNNGFKEIHLGSKSQIIINPENEKIGEIKSAREVKRKQIKDLNSGEFVGVIGTIVQVFEPKYYNSCPVCSKKVIQQGELFSCQEHGEVPAKKVPIVNIFFDDGTGSIRAVLFRDQALKVTGEKTDFEEIKKEVLGKQLLLQGKVTKNDMFDRIELVVNNVEEPSPEELMAEVEKI